MEILMKKLLAIIQIIILCLSSVLSVSAADSTTTGLIGERNILEDTQSTIGKLSTIETTNLSTSWEDKVDPYLLELIQIEQQNETIPVWLWMEDIDHEEVENMVYERTGLCESNLSVVDENLPEELASQIANIPYSNSEENAQIKEEFQGYLNKTQTARKAEARRVDEYLSELRTVQAQLCAQKCAAVFSQLDIPEENIIMSDMLAPVYIVYVEKNDIQTLAENPLVTAIYYYDINAEEMIEGTAQSNTLNNVVMASSIGRIRDEVGLIGDGVKVGVIDSGKVESSTTLPNSRITYMNSSENFYSDHATNVANIAAGLNGVAPKASIYSASNLLVAIQELAKRGVHVANYSMGSTRGSTDYTSQEIYVDYLVKNLKFTLVKSAGNSHGTITSPGLAYNVITVGGYFNQGTEDATDDIMYAGSNYDSLDGCLKPDFVASQSYMGASTGTSYAAPFVTGVIALLYELRPTLQAQPEAVKAILMASCHRKVSPSAGDQGEQMSDGLTEHQGAGAIDPYMAIAIAGKGNYGIRTLPSNSTQELVNFIQPSYASSGLNVSLAWSVENLYAQTKGDEIDLNLTLYRNYNWIGSSNHTTSSSEMIYVIPSNTDLNYSVKINRNSPVGNTVRYAFAFSVSRFRYQFSNSNDGLVLLKNAATEKYATLISSETIYQKSLSWNRSQQWLLYGNQLYSAENNKILSVGPAVSLSSYKKAVTQDISNSSLIIFPNGDGNDQDGTVSIYDANSGNLLGVYNNLSNDTFISWYPLSNVSNYQKWYLESVEYQRGDVNFDGIIDANDSLLVLQYVAVITTLNETQQYYADVDGDGIIDSMDANLILQIASNQL